MIGVKNAYITSAVFEDMPSFTPVPVRGYTLMGTANALQSLGAMPGISQGVLSSDSVAQHVSSFIQLDQASTPISIANGWGDTRCSVLIEVMVELVNGNRTMYRFRCYTDRVDFSLQSGLPANDLTLYVNTVEELKLSPTNMPRAVKTAQQVYYNPAGANSYGTDSIYSVRPSDVLTDVSFIKMQEEANMAADAFDDIASHTAVSLTMDVPITMNMELTAAPTWLTTILNAYISAQREKENGTNTGSALASAIDSTTSLQYYQNPFVGMLCKAMNNIFTSLGWFTWNDLCAIDPQLRTDSQRVTHVVNSGISTECATLDGNTLESTIAQTVATHVRPWMYEASIAMANFTATNMTINGQVSVSFNEAVHPIFQTDDNTRNALMSMFLGKVRTLLMPQITQLGLIDISVTVSASHSSNITVLVTVQDGHPRRYTFPAFMDNNFSPMLSRRTSTDIGKTVEVILDAVDLSRAKTYSGPQAPFPQQYSSYAAPAPQYAPVTTAATPQEWSSIPAHVTNTRLEPVTPQSPPQSWESHTSPPTPSWGAPTPATYPDAAPVADKSGPFDI